MNEWNNKKAKIFVRNLSDKPIIYTGKIISYSPPFITISDKTGKIISINVADIIQIKEESY